MKAAERDSERGSPTTMAPLQFAVYWRLALIFFFMAFLFFLDLFAVSRATSSCNNVPGELPAASRTFGEVSSSAHTQNWTTWEVREVNGSLLQVLLPQQDEITGGNDTERENVSKPQKFSSFYMIGSYYNGLNQCKHQQAACTTWVSQTQLNPALVY